MLILLLCLALLAAIAFSLSYFLFTKSRLEFAFVASYVPLVGHQDSARTAAWFNFTLGGRTPRTEFEDLNRLIIETDRIQFLEPLDWQESGASLEIAVRGFTLDNQQVASGNFAWQEAEDGSFRFNDVDAPERVFFNMLTDGRMRIETQLEPGVNILTGDLRGFEAFLGDASHLVVLRFAFDKQAPSGLFDIVSLTPSKLELARSTAVFKLDAFAYDVAARYSGSFVPGNATTRVVKFGAGGGSRSSAHGQLFLLVLNVGGATSESKVSLTADVRAFEAQRSSGLLTVGSRRFEIQGVDHVLVRQMRGVLRVNSRDESVEASGSSTDIRVNGEQLVRSRFEELHPAVQGALGAGMIIVLSLVLSTLLEPFAEQARARIRSALRRPID
jgi:hypothetical protein